MNKKSCSSNEEKSWEGETKDEQYDYNDFLIFNLEPNQKYTISAESKGAEVEKDISIGEKKYQFINVYMED